MARRKKDEPPKEPPTQSAGLDTMPDRSEPAKKSPEIVDRPKHVRAVCTECAMSSTSEFIVNRASSRCVSRVACDHRRRRNERRAVPKVPVS